MRKDRNETRESAMLADNEMRSPANTDIIRVDAIEYQRPRWPARALVNYAAQHGYDAVGGPKFNQFAPRLSFGTLHAFCM